MAAAILSLTILATAMKIGHNNGHSSFKVLKHVRTIVCSPFSFVIPSKHVMSTHIFKEGLHERCKLAYEGDVPVLTLIGDADTCGMAQGMLLAEQIQSFLKTWGSVLWLVIPDPKKAVELCDNLKRNIPKEYIDEMNGLVKGYNEVIYHRGLGDRLTLDELLLLHLVPDIEHTYPSTLAKKFIPALGCTVILDKGDEETGPIFGRHMDWPSLDVAGKATLLVRRIHSSGKITHEIGAPGLIGTVTGMTIGGLALAMNVALGDTQNHLEGLPSIFINRILLNHCDTVEDALKLAVELSPLGPYHLSLADKNGQAASVHFYQGENNQHFIRTLNDVDHIVTTNCRYNSSGRYRHYFNSEERHANIEKVYKRHEMQNQSTQRKNMVQSALRSPLVNNIETTLSAIMMPKLGIIEVVFANAFAGDNPAHPIRFP